VCEFFLLSLSSLPRYCQQYNTYISWVNVTKFGSSQYLSPTFALILISHSRLVFHLYSPYSN
jgi:hypothetical protein